MDIWYSGAGESTIDVMEMANTLLFEISLLEYDRTNAAVREFLTSDHT